MGNEKNETGNMGTRGSIPDTLNISNDRAKNITGVLNDIMNGTDRVDVLLQNTHNAVSNLPNNEVFFAGVLIGRLIERNEIASDPLAVLMMATHK